MIESIINFDKNLLIKLNNLGTEKFDSIWIFLTSTKASIPLVILILYLTYKKYNNKSYQILLLFLSCICLSDIISVNCFKNVFMRYRPCYDPEIENLVRVVKNKGGLYGFVSSHATIFFSVLTIFRLLFPENKITLIILTMWTLIVCYSRIYLGKHFPLDIVFGWLIGFLIASTTYYLYKIIIKIK